MANVELPTWWKAKEIPLIEADWRNIRLYCEQSSNPFEWDRCLYVVRLSPPYALIYGDSKQLVSPLLYVGSGDIRQRWASHRKWLYELGHAIPGGRYEVWVCQPRRPGNQDFYADIEAAILTNFRERTGKALPLRNQRIETSSREHIFADGFFEDIIRDDRRYLWAMRPRRGSAFGWY